MRKDRQLPVGRSGYRIPAGLPAVPVPIDRKELAWAAGFYDGEGSTFSGPKGHPIISITQASHLDIPEVLLRFHRAVGGIGWVVGPFHERDYLPKWFYRTSGYEMVQAVISLLWPWLGQVKREQATAVLLRFRAAPLPARRTGVRLGRPLNLKCKRGHDYSDAIVEMQGPEGRHLR